MLRLCNSVVLQASTVHRNYMTAHCCQDWRNTFGLKWKNVQGYINFCRCWHVHTHMQIVKFIAKRSELIKKVRPPNTLQCDSRFNETLIEMSSCSLPLRSTEEMEKRCVWFLMSQRVGGCQYIHSGGRASQRITQISSSFCKGSSFITAPSKAEETHNACASYDSWHRGLKPWKWILGVCGAVSSHCTDMMHLCGTCLVELWIISSLDSHSDIFILVQSPLNFHQWERVCPHSCVFLLCLLYGGLPQLKLQVYEISACWEFYAFCRQPVFNGLKQASVF